MLAPLARVRNSLVLAAALAALALAALPPAAHAFPFAPEQGHSPNADDTIAVYWVMFAVAALIVLAVNAALIAAVVRFRHRRGREPARVRGGRGIQPRAGAALGLLAAAIFVLGVVFTARVRDVEPSGPEGLEAASVRTAQLGIEPPAGEPQPLRVLVSGQQWLWRYEYPDGTFSFHELVVPVDTTVVLTIDSTDVVHRWSIPSLGGKFDAVPGRDNQTWFRADEEGTYEGQSAAFSGPGYATMRARVRVVSVPEYEAWLEQQQADIREAQTAVQQRIEQLAGQGSATAAQGAEGGQ
jgi:cytochrome c oxidase subunit 2